MHSQKVICEDVKKGSSISQAKTILVMDDEDFIRQTFQEILECQGYKVELANCGEEVIEKVRKKIQAEQTPPYDAVIMDLTIPGKMGGKDAIQVVRELSSELIVFVSSGHSYDPIMALPQRYGFTDKIQKPFKIAQLLELFSRYL